MSSISSPRPGPTIALPFPAAREAEASSSPRRLDVQGLFFLLALILATTCTAPWLAETRELPRRTIVELFAIGLIVCAIIRDRWNVEKRIARSVALFGAALLVASAAAESPLRSMMGAYEGHAGALAWICYLFLFIAAPNVQRLTQLLWTLVGLAFVQVCIGALEASRGDALRGTLGHPTFFAAFMLIATIGATALMLDEEQTWRRWVLVIAVSVFATTLTMTGRRGPVVGLVVALTFLLLTSKRKLRLALAGAVIAASITAASFAPTGPVYEPRAIDRWAELVDSQSVPTNIATASQRVDFYRVALRVAFEKPIFGWGFGAFRDLYASKKNTARFESSVHNLFLEVLIASGLVGVCGLLGLAFAVGTHFLRNRKAMPSSQHAGKLLGAAAIFVGYLVHLSFNFDQPAVGVWVFAIGGAFLSVPNGERLQLGRLQKGILLVVMSAFAGLVVLRAAGDFAMARGLQSEEEATPKEAISWFEKGVAAAPWECLYTLKLAGTMRMVDATGTAEQQRSLLLGCIEREPRNAFLHHHLGLSYLIAGRGGLLDQSRGIAELERATELAPQAASLRQGLAQMLASRGDTTAALVEIDRAIVDEPERAGLHNDRGNILRMLGRGDEAREAYQQARALAPEVRLYQQNAQLLERSPAAH